MKKAHVEMTEKTALEIAENFFEVLKTLFKITPVRFSCEDLFGEITIKCNDTTATIKKDILPSDEEHSELHYKFFYKNRSYELEFVQDEDLFGYFSCLTNIDRSTYVFCNIIEYYKDDEIRCEMDFAFDIEKRTFVELFLIEHHNKQGLIRECQKIDYIESLLYGKEII